MERKPLIRKPDWRRQLLDRIELERYQRRLEDLNEQYKALRDHLDAVSRVNLEFYRRRTELYDEAPTVSKPAAKPKRKKK